MLAHPGAPFLLTASVKPDNSRSGEAAKPRTARRLCDTMGDRTPCREPARPDGDRRGESRSCDRSTPGVLPMSIRRIIVRRISRGGRAEPPATGGKTCDSFR